MKKLLLLLTIVLCVACGKDAIEEMDVYTPPAGAVVGTPTPTQTQTQTTSDDRTFFQANEGKWFSDSVTEFEGYDGTTIVYDEGEEAGLLITSAKMLGYYFPESDCASEDDAETIIENTATKLVYYSDRTDSDGYQEDIYTFTRSGDSVIAVLEDKLDGTLEFRSTRTFITTDIDFSAACGNYKDFFGIVEITTDVSSEIETSNELALETDLNDDSDYLDSAQRTITTTKTLTNGEETGVVSSTNDWEITEDVAFDPTSVSKILTCIDRCHSGRAYAFIDGKVIAVIYGIDGDLSISTPSNSTFNFDDLEIVSHNPIEGTYVVRRISDQYWWTVGDEFDGTIDEFVAYVTDQGNSIYNGYEGQVQDGIYVSEKRRSSGVNENDLANTSFGPHSGYQFEVVNNKIVDYSTYSSANEEWTNWGKELGWNNIDKVNVTAWSDTQISVTHGYEGAPNSIVQFIAIQSDLTILAGTVVEDPADTAEYSGWTEWVPAQGDGSAPTFTQTRERGCIIYINGEEDNPPAQCGDDKVQTREVADSNYQEEEVIDPTTVNGYYELTKSINPYGNDITYDFAEYWKIEEGVIVSRHRETVTLGGADITITEINGNNIVAKSSNGITNYLTKVDALPCVIQGSECDNTPDGELVGNVTEDGFQVYSSTLQTNYRVTVEFENGTQFTFTFGSYNPSVSAYSFDSDDYDGTLGKVYLISYEVVEAEVPVINIVDTIDIYYHGTGYNGWVGDLCNGDTSSYEIRTIYIDDNNNIRNADNSSANLDEATTDRVYKTTRGTVIRVHHGNKLFAEFDCDDYTPYWGFKGNIYFSEWAYFDQYHGDTGVNRPAVGVTIITNQTTGDSWTGTVNHEDNGGFYIPAAAPSHWSAGDKITFEAAPDAPTNDCNCDTSIGGGFLVSPGDAFDIDNTQGVGYWGAFEGSIYADGNEARAEMFALNGTFLIAGDTIYNTDGNFFPSGTYSRGGNADGDITNPKLTVTYVIGSNGVIESVTTTAN